MRYRRESSKAKVIICLVGLNFHLCCSVGTPLSASIVCRGNRSKATETVQLQIAFANQSVKIAPELLHPRRTHCLQMVMVT